MYYYYLILKVNKMGHKTIKVALEIALYDYYLIIILLLYIQGN